MYYVEGQKFWITLFLSWQLPFVPPFCCHILNNLYQTYRFPSLTNQFIPLLRRQLKKVSSHHYLTTPTAEAVGFFFANIPLTYFQEKDAEAELGRTTLERKTVFQEGKVCANYAVLSAILFIFLGLSLGCLVSCLFFFDK